MATQGIVTLVRGQKVMFKAVAGCDGYLAADVANEVKKRAGIGSARELLDLCLDVGFGDETRLVVQSQDENLTVDGVDEGDLSALYRDADKLQMPRFNPRWDLGTAEFVEIVDLDEVTRETRTRKDPDRGPVGQALPAGVRKLPSRYGGSLQGDAGRRNV